ncbi:MULTISPECIES: hypothetical protein, partial [unclassified Lactobacillus]|uniref:hypothetical protein n=1 Tax=unclassified Lactobacillus TaxID=2620435 RepID=UPI001E2BECBB
KEINLRNHSSLHKLFYSLVCLLLPHATKLKVAPEISANAPKYFLALVMVKRTSKEILLNYI